MGELLPIELFVEFVRKQPMLYGQIAQLNKRFSQHFAPLKLEFVELCLRPIRKGVFTYTLLPNDVLHGVETQLFKDKDIPCRVINWWFGKKHGKEFKYYITGNVQFETNWEHGVKVGEEIHYGWSSGRMIYRYVYDTKVAQIATKYSYGSGGLCSEIVGLHEIVYHGDRVCFHPNGAKRKECHYVHGVKEGRWVKYNDEGMELEKRIYVNGEMTDRWFVVN
ncbi:MORN repeat-containing protein [Faustovirus ST1]|nr:MORN repeat-containing protein [Faustovirus ST1]